MESNQKRSSKALGAQGEHIVYEHLQASGWKLLERNYRCSAGEIDIIAEQTAEHGPVIVFVEVKLRRTGAHGSGLEAIDERKRLRLAAVAAHYLGSIQAGGYEPACRFDVAVVTPTRDGLLSVVLHSGVFTA